jgi:hypothetical protein
MQVDQILLCLLPRTRQCALEESRFMHDQGFVDDILLVVWADFDGHDSVSDGVAGTLVSVELERSLSDLPKSQLAFFFTGRHRWSCGRLITVVGVGVVRAVMRGCSWLRSVRD